MPRLNTHPGVLGKIYHVPCGGVVIAKTSTLAWNCKQMCSSACAQVHLIMMGERYRQMLDCRVDPLQQAQVEHNTAPLGHLWVEPDAQTLIHAIGAARHAHDWGEASQIRQPG